MKMSQLKSILLVCFAGFLLAGCCSTHCVDCIPHAKMPYALYDKGVKYYLTDHVSIDQMMESETEQDFIQKRWPEILRQKFPNDKELLAYLDIEAQIRVIHAVEPGYGGLYDHNFAAFIGLQGWICSFQPTHDVKQRPCQQG